jgi:hypothetical protein
VRERTIGSTDPASGGDLDVRWVGHGLESAGGKRVEDEGLCSAASPFYPPRSVALRVRLGRVADPRNSGGGLRVPFHVRDTVPSRAIPPEVILRIRKQSVRCTALEGTRSVAGSAAGDRHRQIKTELARLLVMLCTAFSRREIS